MKIKVNDKHNGTITLYVCKSNDGKPYTEQECERLYNDIQKHGISTYHQTDLTAGYRIRLFKLDNYIYLTMALTIPGENYERVTIQEFEPEHESDALQIAKFFKRNYRKLLEQSRGPVNHDA